MVLTLGPVCYFHLVDPWEGGGGYTHSMLFLYYWSQIDKFCIYVYYFVYYLSMYIIIYYYVLQVTNLVDIRNRTLYIVHFRGKKQKGDGKGHPFSHFYNIDQRLTNLICMCRSTIVTPLFKTVILRNIRLN